MKLTKYFAAFLAVMTLNSHIAISDAATAHFLPPGQYMLNPDGLAGPATPMFVEDTGEIVINGDLERKLTPAIFQPIYSQIDRPPGESEGPPGYPQYEFFVNYPVTAPPTGTYSVKFAAGLPAQTGTWVYKH